MVSYLEIDFVTWSLPRLVQDELVWAAAWLYRATNDQTYLDYLGSANTGGTRNEFSWDDKYTGAQVLVSKVGSGFIFGKIW